MANNLQGVGQVSITGTSVEIGPRTGNIYLDRPATQVDITGLKNPQGDTEQKKAKVREFLNTVEYTIDPEKVLSEVFGPDAVFDSEPRPIHSNPLKK